LPPEIERNRWGFVVTEKHLETSMKGVCAAGDVRAGSTKQAASAAGEGATAALMIREFLRQGDACSELSRKEESRCLQRLVSFAKNETLRLRLRVTLKSVLLVSTPGYLSGICNDVILVPARPAGGRRRL
jgi:hypothetical protein